MNKKIYNQPTVECLQVLLGSMVMNVSNPVDNNGGDFIPD